MLTDVVGSVAAVCTTAAFVPQVIHTWRTRDVRAISFGMYLIFTFGVFAWLIYGLMLHSWPIIAANLVTFSLAFTVLVLKYRFDRQQD